MVCKIFSQFLRRVNRWIKTRQKYCVCKVGSYLKVYNKGKKVGIYIYKYGLTSLEEDN